MGFIFKAVQKRCVWNLYLPNCFKFVNNRSSSFLSSGVYRHIGRNFMYKHFLSSGASKLTIKKSLIRVFILDYCGRVKPSLPKLFKNTASFLKYGTVYFFISANTQFVSKVEFVSKTCIDGLWLYSLRRNFNV